MILYSNWNMEPFIWDGRRCIEWKKMTPPKKVVFEISSERLLCHKCHCPCQNWLRLGIEEITRCPTIDSHMWKTIPANKEIIGSYIECLSNYRTTQLSTLKHSETLRPGDIIKSLNSGQECSPNSPYCFGKLRLKSLIR